MSKFTITIEVEKLATAIKLATQAIDKSLTGNTLFGVYQQILVKPSSQHLQFTAVNLDFTVQITVANAHYSVDGECNKLFDFCIGKPEFLTLLQKLKGQVSLTVSNENGTQSDSLTLIQDKITYTIEITSPEGFPVVSRSINSDSAKTFVPPKLFKRGFDSVNHVKQNTSAKKMSELNPTQGIRVRISDVIDFTAVSNYLLVKWQDNLPTASVTDQLILSAPTVFYILQAILETKASKNWTLVISDSKFTLEQLVDGYGICITGDSIPGFYPNVEGFLTAKFVNALTINRKQFLASVERASCFAKNLSSGSQKPVAKIKIDDAVVITVADRFNESIGYAIKQPPPEKTTFAFDFNLLKATLNSSGSESITWEFNNQLSPCKFSCEHLSAILMPVALKEDSDAS